MNHHEILPFQNLVFRIICLSLIALSISGPLNVFAGNSIRINGSGSALETLKPFMKAYGKTCGNVSFTVEKPSGSKGALKALSAGAIDIAIISKPPDAAEEVKALRLTHFGKTPLVIVTEKNVPVKDISTKELEDIYSGTKTKWPNGENIRVILRPRMDADTNIMKKFSPAMAQAIDKAHLRQGMKIAQTDIESNEAVSKTPGGVGAAGLSGVLTGDMPLKVLSFNGITPGPKTLADGSYPLAKNIYFVTTGKVPATAAKFLQFIYSARGRAIAKSIGILVTITEK